MPQITYTDPTGNARTVDANVGDFAALPAVEEMEDEMLYAAAVRS
jgi:hypothetical protein